MVYRKDHQNCVYEIIRETVFRPLHQSYKTTRRVFWTFRFLLKDNNGQGFIFRLQGVQRRCGVYNM